MQSFNYNGVEYRSLKECCKELNLSYSKARRLTRHYVKAKHDPRYAVQWTIDGRTPPNELKTPDYRRDYEQSKIRLERFYDKTQEDIFSMFGVTEEELHGDFPLEESFK